MSHIYRMRYTYCGFDIIDKVGVMTQIQWTLSIIVGVISSKWWIEIKKCGCDVLYNANNATDMARVMSYQIHVMHYI